MNKNRGILAERLKILRSQKGLTQYELAEQMGCSRGLIGNYEQGSRQPDYTMLKKFADFFNVSTDYLVGHKKNIITEDGHKKKVITEDETIIKIKETLVKTGIVTPTGEMTSHDLDALISFIENNANNIIKHIKHDN